METITVSGTDYDSVILAAEDMTNKLYEIDGVTAVLSELTSRKSKVNIDIDPMLAAQLNVNPAIALKTVRTATSGVSAGDITLTGTEYDILIEYPEDSFDTTADLATLNIPTLIGTYIPLESIADIYFADSMQSVTRENGQYFIDLEVSVASGAEETVLAEVETLKTQNTYPGISFEQLSSDAFDDTISQLLGAIATSIFLVFMVMAMQFESPRFSFMVMTSVMFSFIGSFLLLFITDMDISMISLMGILMLIGIVVNNDILFVDTTNHLKTTMPLRDALIQTGKMRMRPILMTTMTTILSMIPPSLGIGEGSEVLQSMGIVIIGGLITSTLLVLLLMPAFYLIIDKKNKIKH